MNLGKSIRVGLANKNESRAWLASQLSVSPAYISQLCNEQKQLSAKQMEKFANALGVSVSQFIKWGE